MSGRPIIIRKLASLTALLFIGMLATAAVGGPAQARQSSSSADDANCSFDRFTNSIADHALWRAMLMIKHRYMYLPESGDSISQRMRLAEAAMQHKLRAEAGTQVFDMLGLMSTRHNTIALIYQDISTGGADGPGKTCVWLVDQHGIVASGFIDMSSDWQPERIWVGLGVLARSARTHAFARARGQDCDFSAATDQPPLTPDQLRSAQAALTETANELLPPTIKAALSLGDGNGRLLILPAAAVGKTPFAALPIGGASLIDKFAILILPGPDALGVRLNVSPGPGLEEFIVGPPDKAALNAAAPLQAKSGTRNALVVAAPDMSNDPTQCWPQIPDALDEGHYAAGKLGDGHPLFGAAATWKGVEQRLHADGANLRIIYFATHGSADPVNPADGSYLALRSRLMTGANIQTLKLLSRPVVIMSACETGLGKQFSGGIYGLADAWWYAGARQVVMTLWDISDHGTDQLMHRFIDDLVGKRAQSESAEANDGAEYALARAIREMKGTLQDPAVWGAFSAYGNPSVD